MADLSLIPTDQLTAELLSRQRPTSIQPGEIVVRSLKTNQDSVEIGTAGKGGVVKIYFDAGSTDDEIKMRIDAAFRARAYAQIKLTEP